MTIGWPGMGQLRNWRICERRWDGLAGSGAAQGAGEGVVEMTFTHTQPGILFFLGLAQYNVLIHFLQGGYLYVHFIKI